MKVIRYKEEKNWTHWVIIAVLIAVIVWLWRKVRKLEKKFWQVENK